MIFEDKYKFIIIALLLDGSVAKADAKKYRVRDHEGNPLKSFGYQMFYKIKKYCKKKDGLWIINKKLVLGLHGKNFVNKKYWEIRNGKKCKTEKDEAGSVTVNNRQASSVVHFLE